MSEKVAIARPYAKAAFMYALESKTLDAWTMMLQDAAAIIKNPSLFILLNDPRVTNAKIAKIILEIGAHVFDSAGKNFIEILVAGRRLNILPEIADLYEHYRADYQKEIEVYVMAAYPLSASEQTGLAQALKIRLQREVSLQCGVDRDLLGGAIIRAGDWVIDGSVKGKIRRLVKEMRV